MKKYVLIFLAVLLIPFAAYSKNMSDIKCDFQENDKALIGNILQKEAVYKNDKTNGILCYKYADRMQFVIPIKKGKADGTFKAY